jgi:hypothetical protein
MKERQRRLKQCRNGDGLRQRRLNKQIEDNALGQRRINKLIEGNRLGQRCLNKQIGDHSLMLSFFRSTAMKLCYGSGQRGKRPNIVS